MVIVLLLSKFIFIFIKFSLCNFLRIMVVLFHLIIIKINIIIISIIIIRADNYDDDDDDDDDWLLT